MAKPNYSFEKRQRELAKKKKKEEKLKEKAGRRSGSDSGEAESENSRQESVGGHGGSRMEGQSLP